MLCGILVRLHRVVRVTCWVAVLGLGMGAMSAAGAQTLSPSVLARVKAATFEVVAAKPTHDPLTYAKPLPMDLLPYQQRTDKYFSIGTAFAIGPNRYVTAGHVLMTSRNSLWGPLALRDDEGHVYAIGKIEKFALRRDFVVFSLVDSPKHAVSLPVDTHPVVNQAVYAVGNAFGSGVVVRAGTYTSDTPEQQDGTWKWIRFSAAASPGNSGGPLLDQKGRVIGVVLASSPDENLNYALPISEVLNAPANLARFDHRVAYGFDLIDSKLNATFKEQIALPKSLPEFNAAFLKLDFAWEDRQLKALFAQQKGQMFPDGQGSSRLLHDVASLRTTPWLYTRNPDGVWASTGRRVKPVQLGDNGYLALGIAGRTVLFHLRVPDDVPAATLRRDPEAFMKLLLQSGLERRDVAQQRIKITSFGRPDVDKGWTDRWQRHWRVLVWLIPFANRYKIVFALPVPDGYVGLMRTVRAVDEHTNLISLEAITNFFDTAYTGTLAQWTDYLQDTSVLPAALRHVRIRADYGKAFHYTSPRVSFSFPASAQKVQRDSRLTLGLNYSRIHGDAVWGVSDIRITAQVGVDNWINVQRHVKPSADLGDHYQVPWRKIVNREFPWNGVVRNDNGISRITGVLRAPDHGATVRYSIFYARTGRQAQKVMQSRLAMLMHGAEVHENGHPLATDSHPARRTKHTGAKGTGGG